MEKNRCLNKKTRSKIVFFVDGKNLHIENLEDWASHCCLEIGHNSLLCPFVSLYKYVVSSSIYYFSYLNLVLMTLVKSLSISFFYYLFFENLIHSQMHLNYIYLSFSPTPQKTPSLLLPELSKCPSSLFIYFLIMYRCVCVYMNI